MGDECKPDAADVKSAAENVSGPTREQYAELGARILAALPVDPRDGTMIVGHDPQGCPEWGRPQQIVNRIEGVFFQLDLQVVPGDELWNLRADRDALAAVIEQVRALLDGCDACALADEITELLPEVSP